MTRANSQASAAPRHPRGTLAILALYASLFALGWAALYFLDFLERGGPRP